MIILSALPDPPDALPALVYTALLLLLFSITFLQRFRGVR
jgi:hypothetical protein